MRFHSRLFAVALVLPLALVGPRGARGGDDPDGLEQKKKDLVLRVRVSRAIDLGAAWLAARQDKDGSFRLENNPGDGPFAESRHRFGESALATLTLAHCGYDAERPEIKSAIGYLRRHYRSLMRSEWWTQASSYSLALVVLSLHTLYYKEAVEGAEAEKDRYGNATRKDGDPCRYPAWARAMLKEILEWMLENRSARGLFRYPGGLPGATQDPTRPIPVPPGPMGPGGMTRGPEFYGPEDLSNTQYVLLALWAGSRCEIPVPHDVLEAIARRLLALQEKNGPVVERTYDPMPAPSAKPDERYAPPSRGPTGSPPQKDHARGFGYTPGDSVTGSMTTAGLSSLAIVKAILQEQGMLDPALSREITQGIWDAVAWLAVNFEVRANPPLGPVWHYYYLYGLERAGALAGKRFLGTHDWYREGAEVLVEQQRQTGEWTPPSPIASFGMRPPGAGVYAMTLHDTCFALLFLERTTMLPKAPLLPDPTVTPDGSGGSR